MSSTRSSPPTTRRARGWALAVLALGAAGAGMPSPPYPAYQAELGFDDVALTFVYAVYPLVGVPAVFLLGPLGDRLPPRRVLRAGVVIAAAGSLALALADATGWLVAGRVAYGIALAAVTGAGVAVATGGVDAVRAGRLSALLFLLGTGAGPVLGGALTRFGPTPGLAPFAVALVLLAVVFVGLGSIRSPPTDPSRPALPAPRGEPGTLVVAAVNGFLGWAVSGLFLGLLSSVAERVLGLRDPLVAGGATGAVLLWSMLTVPAVRRLGTRRAQVLGLVALAVAAALLVLDVGSLPAVLAACVVAGLANGLLYGGATTAVATMAVPGRASRTAAAVYSAFYLGAGLPVLLVGLLTTTLTLDAALTVMAGTLLALILVMIVVTPVSTPAPPTTSSAAAQ